MRGTCFFLVVFLKKGLYSFGSITCFFWCSLRKGALFVLGGLKVVCVSDLAEVFPHVAETAEKETSAAEFPA